MICTSLFGITFVLFLLKLSAGKGCFDFFLHQINMYPTRHNNILDLVQTIVPDNILNLSCVSAETFEISSDHHLTFFDFLPFTKQKGCDKRTVFNFHLADWSGFLDALHKCNLSPNESTYVNTDWERWRNIFLDMLPLNTYHAKYSNGTTVHQGLMAKSNVFFRKKVHAEKRQKNYHVQNFWKNSAISDVERSPC